jgi:hypothetical protein
MYALAHICGMGIDSPNQHIIGNAVVINERILA